MNTKLLFEALSNPEFWVAMCLSVMIASVFGAIVQDVWDTFIDLKDEECLDSANPISREIEIGETVWDISTQQEVIFIGHYNNKATVLYEEGCIRDVNLENLKLL